MSEFLKILLAFTLTAFFGNKIAHNLQYSSWRRQQKFLGQEKEYLQLRELTSQISELAGKRLYAMRKASWSLRSTDIQKVDLQFSKYDDALTEWNEKLGTFTSQLTFYAAYRYATRLEEDIHSAFQKAGSEIESLARARREGIMPSSQALSNIGQRLDQIQGIIFSFNRDAVHLLEDRRKEIYFGEDIPYERKSIEKFSTPELLKALFISDVDTHSVIRPAADPHAPTRTRN